MLIINVNSKLLENTRLQKRDTSAEYFLITTDDDNSSDGHTIGLYAFVGLFTVSNVYNRTQDYVIHRHSTTIFQENL